MTEQPSHAWSSLHERLRIETHPRHEALEAAVGVDKLIRTRFAYAAYLARLWSVHKAAEAALCGLDFSELGFDYTQRQRSKYLEADLQALGFPPGTLNDKSIPPAPDFVSVHAALGGVYVVEGSALGARAILPSIKTSLGFDETRGASFFIGFGSDGKAIWRACLAALGTIEADSALADGIVAGANETFALFQDHLPASSSRRPNVTAPA